MRSAIVTGGAGGIGSAVCRRLAADGYAVAVGYNKSEQEALTLCEELRKSGTAMVLQLDLTDPASLLAAYRRFRAELGVPEVLVNNGGAAHIGIFTDMSDSEILNLINTDLTGAVLLTRHAAEDMVRQHRGRIINISSVWGVTGASCEAVYSAAKAGLIGFTKALGKELGPSGITVNCIAAGLIDTKMNSCLTDEDKSGLISEIPAGRMGSPEEIASLAAYLCSGEAAYINAQVIGCDGGWI